MEIITAISSQIWAIAQMVPVFGKYQLEKNAVVSSAIGSTREALNRTIMFMKKGDFSDEKGRADISTLWNTASEKVGVIDKHLGRTLGLKSRFWADPETFRRTGRDDAVISLVEVTDELERLYNKLS
ncbi:MAG: hypothetical protein WBD16_00170 [Pyrinomonadaceae bacterium]